MSSLSDDIAGTKGSVPTCADCLSSDVVRDAYGQWNPETGLWELQDVYDTCCCRTCGSDAEFVWIAGDDVERNTIAFLNDQFRKYARGEGSILITNGVSSQGEAFMHAVALAVKDYDQFTADNDPHGEHDFGSIELQGEKLFWKIDYYDKTMEAGSPNPSDERLTHRVLTIMLANEY